MEDREESIRRLDALNARVAQSDVPDSMLSLLTALKLFLATLPEKPTQEQLLLIEEMRRL